jgi:hypothetical protein
MNFSKPKLLDVILYAEVSKRQLIQTLYFIAVTQDLR